MNYVQQKREQNLKQNEHVIQEQSEREAQLEAANIELTSQANRLKEQIASSIQLQQQNAAAMAAHQKELEQFTFDHFQKLRAICRDDQKKLFDETIDEIAKMVAGGPHPGDPPPH